MWPISVGMPLAGGIVLRFAVVLFADVAQVARRLVLEDNVQGVDDAGNVCESALVGRPRMRERVA